MNENRLIDYLDHIRQAVHDACGFLDGMSKAEFLSDKRSQQAVIMSLIIIGQAVTKVIDRDPAFAARHSQIPWRNMRGMRNRITRGYFDINLDVVWDTVQYALPELLPHLAAAQIARRRGLADQTLQHECSWPNYRCNEPGEQSCRKARQIKRMRRQPKG